MRILLSTLLALSLLGCAAAEEPAVTQAPTAEVNPAPGSEETDSTEQETEGSETENEIESETQVDPESGADSEVEASAKPTPTRTQAQETEAPSEEPTEQPSQPAPKPTSSQDGYTLAQVAQKNSQSACWVAIDGMVYDLTDWIRSHPGGRASILSLCGTDGTSGFLSQHGGQARPSATLDQYLLGPLVG